MTNESTLEDIREHILAINDILKENPDVISAYNIQTHLKALKRLLSSYISEKPKGDIDSLLGNLLDLDASIDYRKIFSLTPEVCWKITETICNTVVIGALDESKEKEEKHTGNILQKYLGVWDMSDEEWEDIEKFIEDSWKMGSKRRVEFNIS